MGDRKRIVITGMSINTPLRDSLDRFLHNLLQGRSAITRWKTPDSSGIYSKVGGDQFTPNCASSGPPTTRGELWGDICDLLGHVVGGC